MCDQWMPSIKLPLTPEQFHELPRNAAGKLTKRVLRDPWWVDSARSI